MISPISNDSDLNSIYNALSTRDNTPFSEGAASSEASSSLPRTPALSTSDLFDLQCCSPSSLNVLLDTNSKDTFSRSESESASKRLQDLSRESSEWATLSDPISCYAWHSTTEQQRDTILPSWSQDQHHHHHHPLYPTQTSAENSYPSGNHYVSSSHYYSGSPQESFPPSMTRPRSIEHSNLRATGLPFVHTSHLPDSTAPWSGSSYSASSFGAPSNQTSSSFSWDAVQARTPVLSGSPVLSPRSSVSGLASSEYASSVASSKDSRKRSVDEMESDYQHYQPRSHQGFSNQAFNFALPTTSLSLASDPQRQSRPGLSVWNSSPNATPTAAVFPHRRAHSQARPAPLATHLRSKSFDLPSPTYALLQQQLMGETSSNGQHQQHHDNHSHHQAASCAGSPKSAIDWFALDSMYGPEHGAAASSHHFNHTRSQSTSYPEPRSTPISRSSASTSASVSRSTSSSALDNAAVSSSSSTIGLVKGEKVALEAHTPEALAKAVLQPPPNGKEKPVPYPSVTIHCPNPPDSDFESEDVNVRPMRQTGKLKTHDDAYSARWIRYEAQAREAWCSKCEESVPQKWLQLKNSAYGYHTKNVHGVSSHTGRQFAPPIAMKVDSQHMNHGQCFRCQRWVQISSRRNLSWGAWFKHASMCEASAYREKAQANRNSIASNAPTSSNFTATSNHAASQLGDLSISSVSPNSRAKKQRT